MVSSKNLLSRPHFICRGSQSTPGSSSRAACLTSSLSTEKLRRCSVWATATRIHSISGGSTRNGLQGETKVQERTHKMSFYASKCRSTRPLKHTFQCFLMGSIVNAHFLPQFEHFGLFHMKDSSFFSWASLACLTLREALLGNNPSQDLATFSSEFDNGWWFCSLRSIKTTRDNPDNKD